MGYIKRTLKLHQYVWIGNEAKEMSLCLYADADFAGYPRTLRSTSGAHLTVDVPWTCFPQACASARQPSVATSTPEAEIVSLHAVLRRILLPAMDLYDQLLPKGYRKILHEDTAAALQVATTGINKTIRHLNRNLGIAVQLLYEK